MKPIQSFFAIIKAYCAINVLLLPLPFSEGGYILAPIAMAVACFFEALSASRLTDVAYKHQIYSYPLLMKKAMGDKGFIAAKVALSLAHFQFSIGQISFILESLQSTIGAWVGHDSPLWIYGILIWVIYTPLVWIRYFKFLEKAFIFAVFMILLGVMTTVVFALKEIEENDGPGPEVKPFVRSSYWTMVGFAFYMFEGIGCLLPVQREAAQPEQFPRLVIFALLTLFAFYVLFSFLCYYAWGSDLDEAVVTEMLPADNTSV